MANIVGYPSAVIQGPPGKSPRIQGLDVTPTPPTFDPNSITDIIGWWDPSDVSTVMLDGLNVRILADKSNPALNNDLVQLTGSLQPFYNIPGGGAPNFLDFAKTGEFMQTAVFNGGPKGQPNTIFFVNNQKTDTAGTTPLDGLTAGMRHANFNVGTFGSFAGSILFSSVPVDQVKRIYVTVFAGISGKYYFNGGIPDTDNVGTDPWDGMSLNTRFSLGGGSDCNVFEIIAYNKILPPGEFNLVGNFLATNHNLVWTNIV